MSFDEFLRWCAETAYEEPESELHEQLTKWAVAEVMRELKPGAKVLDIGCGRGYAIKLFAEGGMYPTGLSVVSEEVDRLKASGFDVIKCEMHELERLDLFDCIFARHVLEHSPAPLYMLKLIYRALAPGGVFYMEVPLPDTDNHHERNPNHYSCLTASMWIQLISRAGFRDVKGTNFDFETVAGKDSYKAFLCRKY